MKKEPGVVIWQSAADIRVEVRALAPVEILDNDDNRSTMAPAERVESMRDDVT